MILSPVVDDGHVYQWQYAETENGTYANITGVDSANTKELTITDKDSYDEAWVKCVIDSGDAETKPVQLILSEDGKTKGGAVVYAHGTGLHEGNGFFGLSIHPEKEIILIIADEEHRKEIMQAIVRHNGLSTEGAGITFSLPVTNIAGIAKINSVPPEEDDK